MYGAAKKPLFPDIFNVAHASLVYWLIIVYNIIYNHVQYSLLPSSFYKHNIQSVFLSFQDWFGLEESTWCPTLLTIITTTTPVPIRLVKTNERELRRRKCFRNHWCGLVDDSKYPPGHQVIPREVYQGAISFTHVVSQTCFSFFFFFSWQIELTKKKKHMGTGNCDSRCLHYCSKLFYSITSPATSFRSARYRFLVSMSAL